MIFSKVTFQPNCNFFAQRDDFSKLTYLTMFIKESMRLYPPVMIVAREIEKELALKSTLNKLYETVVPIKSRIVLDIFTLHRNESVWEEPEVSIGCGILDVHQT